MKSKRMQQDINKLGKVAVLMGGWSAEREVSLNSGNAVYEALRNTDINVVAIDITRENIMQVIAKQEFDTAFIALHGRGGEDGVIQSVLDVAGIPYTGSGVLASALAMDKLRSKQVLEASGLPTPAYLKMVADMDADYVAATLGMPVMMKPVLEGSSLGMSKVDKPSQLAAAHELASQHPGDVIAERWVQGSEYTVAILGDEALPVIRLETPNTFYDYAAKYQENTTRYHCPCGLDLEAEQQLQRLALAAFNSLGASGWGRVDILTDENNQPWVIELNTVPGMTDHSLVPMAAKAAGYSFSELVIAILLQSLPLSSAKKAESDV